MLVSHRRELVDRATLLGLRSYLLKAETLLESADAHDRLRKHDAGTIRALTLVNTVAEHEDNLRQGAEVCERTLALFDVLDRTDWADYWANVPSWKRMEFQESFQHWLSRPSVVLRWYSRIDPSFPQAYPAIQA